MEIQGKIITAFEARSGESARGTWKSQDFLLETQDGQFSRRMLFNVFGEERLQRFNIQEGMDVTVSFDITAREWNGRWFNDVRAYDVRPVMANAAPVGGAAPFAAPAEPAAPAKAPASDNAVSQDPFASEDGGGSDDNLPF